MALMMALHYLRGEAVLHPERQDYPAPALKKHQTISYEMCADWVVNTKDGTNFLEKGGMGAVDTIFGAISSVWAWHRVSNVALAKFVDDTYGVQRPDCRKRTDWNQRIIFSAFGLDLDPRKCKGFQQALSLLGAKVSIQISKMLSRICPAPEKWKRWLIDIEKFLADNRLLVDDAVELCGRLQWALSLMVHRVGRSY